MLTRKPKIGEKIITKDEEIFIITRFDENIAHITKLNNLDYHSTFIWKFHDGLNTYCTIIEDLHI